MGQGAFRISSVMRMVHACGGTGMTFSLARRDVTASSTALLPDLLTMTALETLPSFAMLGLPTIYPRRPCVLRTGEDALAGFLEDIVRGEGVERAHAGQ